MDLLGLFDAADNYNYHEYRFVEYFTISAEKKREIRNCFLKIIRYSPYNGVDFFINVFLYYLILIRQRALTYPLVFPKQTELALAQLPEYKLAEKIFQALAVTTDSCSEIGGFALLLAAYPDIDAAVNLETWYGTYYSQATPLVETASTKLKSYFIELNENIRRSLYKIFIPEVIRCQFNLNVYFQKSAYIADNAIKCSPLTYFYAQSIAEAVFFKTAYRLSTYAINCLAVLILDQLLKFELVYKPRRVIICSANTDIGAALIKDQLIAHFGADKFADIVLIPFYEARKLNFAELDCCLLNYAEYSYKYSLPFVQVSQLITAKQYREIFAKAIAPGYSLTEKFRALNFDHDKWLFPDYECSAGDFNALLKNPNNKYSVFKAVLTVIDERPTEDEALFQIYHLKDSYPVAEQMIRYIIYLKFSSLKTATDCKLPELVLRYLVEHQDQMNRIFTDGSYEHLFNSIIKEQSYF